MTRDFLQRRVDLAKHLLDQDVLEHYADAFLILTAVLSACAARRWPRLRDRNDRNRFVELLALYSPPEFNTQWVSVPALLVVGEISETDTPYHRNELRFFHDKEIDLCPADARQRYPKSGEVILRRYSYSGLIYNWLRCGYSHEYRPSHRNAGKIPGFRKGTKVEYSNRLVKIDESLEDCGNVEKDSENRAITRIVCFNPEYLIELAEYHAGHIAETPQKPPSSWWVEGK